MEEIPSWFRKYIRELVINLRLLVKSMHKKVNKGTNSGCLDNQYRRRTQNSAISLGELRASFDPGISEWGNLIRVMSYCNYLNTQSNQTGTSRTESSQQVEEKRINNDSESSGERNWNSPNLNITYGLTARVMKGVVKLDNFYAELLEQQLLDLYLFLRPYARPNGLECVEEINISQVLPVFSIKTNIVK